MSNSSYGIGFKREVKQYQQTKEARLLDNLHNRVPFKLIKGDCAKVLKDIPSNSIDLVVTDPPYQYSNFNNHTKTISNSKTFSSNNALLSKITNGFDVPTVLTQLVRVLKHINMYVWCSNDQVYQLLNFMESHYHCHYIILSWYKNNIKRGNYVKNEFCIYFYDDKIQKHSNSMSKDGNYITPENQFEEAIYHHPTIKPIFMLRNLILNSSNYGDKVLDSFVGSGSTGVASTMLGRKFIGIDTEDRCIKEAKYRISQPLSYSEGVAKYEINHSKGFTKNDGIRADKRIVGKVLGSIKIRINKQKQLAVKQVKEAKARLGKLQQQAKSLGGVKVAPKENEKQRRARNIKIGKLHASNPVKYSIKRLSKIYWWISKASVSRACYHYKLKHKANNKQSGTAKDNSKVGNQVDKSKDDNSKANDKSKAKVSNSKDKDNDSKSKANDGDAKASNGGSKKVSYRTSKKDRTGNSSSSTKAKNGVSCKNKSIGRKTNHKKNKSAQKTNKPNKYFKDVESAIISKAKKSGKSKFGYSLRKIMSKVGCKGRGTIQKSIKQLNVFSSCVKVIKTKGNRNLFVVK